MEGTGLVLAGPRPRELGAVELHGAGGAPAAWYLGVPLACAHRIPDARFVLWTLAAPLRTWAAAWKAGGALRVWV